MIYVSRVKFCRRFVAPTAAAGIFQEVINMDSNDKVFGILSYIGILWIVGLAAGKTPFAKFHANQGLVLFLADFSEQSQVVKSSSTSPPVSPEFALKHQNV